MILSRLSKPVTGVVLIFAASSVPLLPSGLHAQDAAKSPAKAKAAAPQGSVQGIKSAIERLASSDFDTRRAAADELAARGKKAVPFLERAIKSSDDPELRWQARRVMRRIESGASSRVRRLEEQESKKAPVRRPSKLDRVQRGDKTPRRRSRGGLRLDGIDDIPGLDPRFAERLREQIEALTGRRGGNPLGGAQSSQSSSLSVRIDQDGVRVEESTVEDGKKKKKVYEAPDMKTLLKKYPQLKGRVGVAPRLRIGRGGIGSLPGFDLPGFGPRGLDLPGFGRGGAGRDPFGGDLRKQFEQMEMRQLRERMRSQFGKDGRRGFDFDFDFDFDVDTDRDASSSSSSRSDGARAEQRREARKIEKRREARKIEKVAPRGPTLGIYVHDEIPAALRGYLDLPAGQGLWIQSVVDGSLAEKSGLRTGDIVTKIGTRKIASPSDVRAALAAKGELTIHYIRKGALKRAKLRR